MTRPLSVLFLCTHNSARSILAEALLNHLGRGRIVAHSAGSTPRAEGRPNPLALRTLEEAGIDTAGLRSKSWDEFIGGNAPPVDLVITDSGTGIPETVAARMMSPFFTTKEVGRGTGLGLSISARIVDAHDGTLTLDRGSRNTRFVIRLPRGTSRG